MSFHPSGLMVHAGDTVVWMNNDIVMQNVPAWPGKNWTSGLIPIEKPWNKVIANTGDYICTIHPMMKGRLIVND